MIVMTNDVRCLIARALRGHIMAMNRSPAMAERVRTEDVRQVTKEKEERDETNH